MLVTTTEGGEEAISIYYAHVPDRSVAAQAVARLLTAFRDVKLEDAWPVAHVAFVAMRLAEGEVRQWLYACRMGLEGIVSKRRDRPYASGPSGDWLKVKCLHREAFVIAGFIHRLGRSAASAPLCWPG